MVNLLTPGEACILCGAQPEQIVRKPASGLHGMTSVNSSERNDWRGIQMRAHVFLGVAALLAASPVAAPAQDFPIPVSAGEVWKGVLVCGGRPLDVNLTFKSVEAAGNSSRGGRRFDIRANLNIEAQGFRKNYYGLESDYSEDSGKMTFASRGFSSIPQGWSPTIGLSGTFDAATMVYRGQARHAGCTSFALMLPPEKIEVASKLRGSIANTVAGLIGQGDGAASTVNRFEVKPLYEFYKMRDQLVSDASTLPCPERVGLQSRIYREASSPDRQAEAVLDLRNLQSSGECRQELTNIGSIPDMPASTVRAGLKRSEESRAEYAQQLSMLAEFNALIDQLPKPRATRAELSQCNAPDAKVFDSPEAQKAFERNAGKVPVKSLLWYWAFQNYADKLVCERDSTDGLTRVTYPDWRAIARAWADSSGRSEIGLSIADASVIAGGLKRMEQQKTEEDRKRKIDFDKQKGLSEEKQRLAKVEREKDERDIKNAIASSSPETIYKRAAMYEREDKNDLAIRLYEYLIGKFPGDRFAIGANNRLSDIRPSKNVAGRSRQIMYIDMDEHFEKMNLDRERMMKEWREQDEMQRKIEEERIRAYNEQVRIRMQRENDEAAERRRLSN